MAERRLIDGRGMEPPEPLERALAELATMGPEDELVMLLNCEPLPLYTILDQNGFGYHSERQPDGSNEVRIRKR